MRTSLLWGMAVVILVAINVAVWQKERVRTHGRVVLLELAPLDPRSLMQGDYMVLDYELAREIGSQTPGRSVDGAAVVRLDEHGVAQFDHIWRPGERLQPDQALIRFRKRGDAVRIGAEAFFFQEGQAARYQEAVYGELKVAPDGEVVLTGLRDAAFAPLTGRDGDAERYPGARESVTQDGGWLPRW